MGKQYSDNAFLIFAILILNLVNALPSDVPGSQSFAFRLIAENIYSAFKLYRNQDDGGGSEWYQK
jgi:hypothetical protein